MNINIIIFSDLDPSNGGVETWLRLFLNEINTKGHQQSFDTINIFYKEDPQKQVSLVRSSIEGLINYRPILLSEKKGLFFNFLKLFKFHHEAIRQIKKDKGDIVISIGSYPTGIFNWISLYLLGYRKKVKHLVWLRTTLSKHIRNHQSRIFSKPIFSLESKSLKDANMVIANGWDTRENYINEYKIDSEVIPNAIDIRRYVNVSSLKNLDSKPVKIAFIGRFYEAKGAGNFIDAINIFNQKYPALKEAISFVFVGWGEKKVEEFATNTSNCELIGRISNDRMHELLGSVHGGVALTKANNTEAGGSGVSNNLLELMVTGRLIIAYDNAIFNQFPRKDFMLFVKENDNEELAACFARIAENPHQYFYLGENAKEYAASFSIENHVQLLTDAVRTVYINRID
ncbi:glycosyltransferase family 4 protein [Chitinophaga sp. 22321]|uniref:Glycosyltransferase family 4 protein n=1 Tax=Chitinophaga hostae TaxID=2831022 RepID=A0ABS5J033_9BACT|nr:glycosyltransferase family 4 protein [Chitinophaga hostae]MBS0028554.1 glycosyltransferase family 4 protein [Chitinophaga hostae]